MAALAAATAAPKWTADAKTFCTLLGHTSSVNALKLRLGGVGDKSVLFSGSGDETIRCWDIKSGECIQGLERAHTGYVSSLAMQGDYIMSSSFDRTICLWNAERRSLVKSIKAHAHCINALCMHDNGVVLSAAWDQCIRVWDLRVRQEGHGFVAALTLPSAPLSIESSGNEVFSGLHDSTIMASDLRTGAQLSTFKGHGGYITSLQITSKGNQLLSGSQDGTVRMTDLRTGAMRTVLDSDKAVFSVHAREDGGTRCVLSGHADGVVRITNIITGAEVKRYAGEHDGQVFSMVSDFDGCLITGAGDGKIVCWGEQPSSAARVPERGGGTAARGGGVGKGAAAVSLQRVWRGWMGRQRSKMQDRVKRPILEPNGGQLAAGAAIKVRSEHRVFYTLDGTEPIPGKAREILAGKGGLGEIQLPAEGGKATLRAKAVGRGGYESASVTIWRDFEWPAAPPPAQEKPKPTIEKAKEVPEPTMGKVGEGEASEVKAPVMDVEKSSPSRKSGTDNGRTAVNSSISKPPPQQQQQKRVGGGFALPPREGSAAEPAGRRTPKKPAPTAEGESSGRKSNLVGRKGAEGADASGRKSSLGGSAAASRKAPLS